MVLKARIVQHVWSYTMRSHLIGRKIVTVGGGTGGFMVNSGLLQYPVEQTAIASAFDNGGSTGRLRDAHGVLPPGDLRQLLVALIDDTTTRRGETLRQLLTYRDTDTKDALLSGHNLGNMWLGAAEKLWGRVEGLERVSELFEIKGKVFPISIDDAHLVAELSDGEVVVGETLIDTRDPFDTRTIKRVYLDRPCFISRGASEALIEADVIVLGPGDHYTSLVPNLLVSGFAEAIALSQAKLVYVANLMTKASETSDFTILSFVQDLLQYGVGRERFDAVLVNSTRPPEELTAMYWKKERAEPVVLRPEENEHLGVLVGEVFEGDYLSGVGLRSELIRHDETKLARALLNI